MGGFYKLLLKLLKYLFLGVFRSLVVIVFQNIFYLKTH
jgi:hypothetical protein